MTTSDDAVPITYMHDLKRPCACQTCQTQLRLDEEAHAKRIVEDGVFELAAQHKSGPPPVEVELTLDDVTNYVSGYLAGQAKRAAVVPGYEKLAAILDEALEQAQAGKGKDRHASGEPFHEQPIVGISTLLGSSDFNLGQVIKKLHESKRLPPERRRAERLGAINYIVASILVDEALEEKKP